MRFEIPEPMKIEHEQLQAKKFTVQIYCVTGPPKTSEDLPAPQAPDTMALEQQAKRFAILLQAKWSQPNSEALHGLDDLYADEVMYYGKKSTKKQVIKAKLAFARKFPQREYRPREPISAACSDSVCMVQGLVDFRSVDPVGKIISKGVASFEYRLLLAGGAFKISMEGGEVINRSRTPLVLGSRQRTSSPVSEAAR